MPRWIERRPGIVHFAALLLLALLAFVLGAIPAGSIVAQGDYFQTTHLASNLSTNLFTWFHLSGEGQYNPLITTWPFYAVQRLLSGLGASDTHVAEYLDFQFMFLSYGSMVVATRLGLPILGRLDSALRRSLAGLTYTLNPITFNIAAEAWGYLHYLLFYTALPVLIAVTWRLLTRPTIRFALTSVLVDGCATVTFNNVAWFYVLCLVQVVLVLIALVQREDRFIRLLWRLVAVVTGETVLAAYVLVPFALAQVTYAGKARTTVAFGGDAATIIRQTSQPVAKVAVLDIYGRYHFPGQDLFPGGGVVSSIVELAALAALALIVLACGFARRDRERILRPAIGLTVTAALLLLTARIEPPLGRVLLPVLTSTAFILLRSPEKIYVLLPVVIITGTGAALLSFRGRRSLRFLVAVVVCALALPFLLGGVHRYLTVQLEPDLTTVSADGYSDAVKIPADYQQAADIANASAADGPVVSVPFSSINSVNWSNYPAWHFVGANFLSDLFRRPVVTADTPDHPALETQMSFQQFDLADGTPSEYLAQLQRFGAGWVLFHKDVTPNMLAASQPTQRALATLTAKKDLTLVFGGPDVDLYRVDPDLVTAPVTLTGGLQYVQRSPVEYDVTAPHLVEGDVLTLRQAQDPHWKVFAMPLASTTGSCARPVVFAPADPTTESGVTTQCGVSGHALDIGRGLSLQLARPLWAAGQQLADSYEATWTVELPQLEALGSRYFRQNSDGSLSADLVIYFTPQSSFYDGLVILALVMLGALGGLVVSEIRRRRGTGLVDAP